MLLTDAGIAEAPLVLLKDEAMEAHVQHVAQSAPFLRAETLRKLLLYLWAHRNEEISEYAVATEALGRRADFDPKMDASVRVQISRLRRKLKDFYETEAPEDGYILHIPMGTHTLMIFGGGNASPAVRLTEIDIDVPPLAVRASLVRVLIIACIALILLSGWLWWSLHRTKLTEGRPLVAATNFWTNFVGANIPVKIILPTPVFFTYPNAGKLHIRDVEVNEFQDWKNSQGIAELARTNGEPKLDHSYTVTSDTLAAIELARYLDRVGLADRVDFEITGDATMNLLERSSVVAFGAHATLEPFRDYLASMNFSLAPHESSVENAQPEIGEQPRYDAQLEGDLRKLEPAIVAVLPGRGSGMKLLILQSRHTSALVSMMTSKVGDSLFRKMYVAHGSPAYFEMVVMNESEGDHIIRSWPVTMHPYTKNAPNGVDVTR